MAVDMVSLSFIFVFLPLSILLYCLAPPRYKSGAVLGISFLFYALTDIAGLCLMAAILLLNYLVIYRIHSIGRKHPLAKLLCGFAVLWTLGIIVAMSAHCQIAGQPLPLGLYIYLLTSLGYMVDYYRGEAPYEKSLVNYYVMCCFFAKLYAGPLVEYSEMTSGFRRPSPSLEQIGSGLMLFSFGLAKKVLLADRMGEVYSFLSDVPWSELSVVSGWMFVFSSAFSIYFLLSGYCDMAMGLGRVFGFSLPHNFFYPFQSRTVSDFFARFNITVSRYIRRYVYRFLGYDTGGALSHLLNLMLVAMLAALWFGLRMNYLIWGGFLGVFMIIENIWGKKFFTKIPPFFLRIYAFSVVMISFAIFAGVDLYHTHSILSAMVGLGGSAFIDNTSLYLLENHGVMFVLCALLSTSLLHRFFIWLEKNRPNLGSVLWGVGSIAIFVLTISFMIL